MKLLNYEICNENKLIFKDILKSEIANTYDLDTYKKNNLNIVENSPDEIINFYYECKNRIEKNYTEDPIELELRKRYDKLRLESDFYYPGGSKINGSFFKKVYRILVK